MAKSIIHLKTRIVTALINMAISTPAELGLQVSKQQTDASVLLYKLHQSVTY